MRLLALIGSFVAALGSGLVTLVMFLTLGLVLHELIAIPLAHVVAGVVAGLCSGWVGTFLASDGTRTKLVQVTAATAAIGVGLGIVLFFVLPLQQMLGRLIYPALISAVLISLSASMLTSRCRTHAGTARLDRRVTALSVGLIVVLVPSVLFVASLFGLTGA